MKKIFFAFAALAALAASCSKETADDSLISNVSGNAVIGGYASEEESRLAVESKKGSAYPCVWSAGDKIGIRTPAGKTVATGTLATGAGERFATFTLAAGTVTPSVGETVRVVYPNTRMMTFSSNTLAADQVQAGAGNPNNNLSAYDFSYADITYTTSGFPGKFTLKHLLSYVRLALSSETFAGTRLNSVTLSCADASLAGTFRTDYNTLAITPLSGIDHVTVSFKDPLVLNGAQKDIWFTLLPTDLSGKNVTLTFNITTADETFEVSSTLPGINLEQGKAYSIDRLGFNPVPGFCPTDTRIKAGEGHAYGQANTFFIQCKDGSTYSGATYRENPEIPSSVTIDYRVRGDRATAVIPDGVSFGWATTDYGITDDASGAYLPRYADYSGSNVDPTGFSFSVDEANYKVTVTNESAHAGSPILLMMKGTKILWGWTFWNIAADGTELKVETLGVSSYQLCNMDIGQPTTDYATWCANLKGSDPDPFWRMTFKYQWGRYLPVFWNTYWSLRVAGSSSFRGNVPAVQGPVSIAESLDHPYGLIVPDPTVVGSTLEDWLDTPDGELWGNCSSELKTMGKKTIYDPCPTGWRLPDFYNLQSRRYSETWTTVSTPGYYGWQGSATKTWGYTTGTFFTAVGVILNKIGNSGASEARIATAGGNANGVSAAGGWWTNFTLQNDYQPAALATVNTGSTLGETPGWSNSQATTTNGITKAHAFAVRCMPDREDR